MDAHPDLNFVVETLSSPKIWSVIGPEPYLNKRNVRGQFACFEEAGSFLMISVHNCNTSLNAAILADLIRGIKLVERYNEGIYWNRKFVPGYYATARSTIPLEGSFDHWYMIGIPNIKDDSFDYFRQLILRNWNGISQRSLIAAYFESECVCDDDPRC